MKNRNKKLTDKEGEAVGRAQKVCVPRRKCTPQGHEGGNGWDLHKTRHTHKKANIKILNNFYACEKNNNRCTQQTKYTGY